jgi:hypothetical protein
MKMSAMMFTVIATLFATVACGGGDDRERRTSRKPIIGGGDNSGGGSSMKAVDMASAGTVSGKVNFAGDAPKRKEIPFTGNADCIKLATETVLDETVVVNGNQTLRDCFVYIDMQDAYPPTPTPVEVDQRGCSYFPHAIGVMTNQTVSVKSSDETLHNVHIFATENPEANFAMPKPGVQPVKFEYPELDMMVKCDVHPWMKAWFYVVSHPFFAVTGEDGSFSITGVPPGPHKLKVRHPKFGEFEAQISVESQKTTTHDFTVNG